MIPVLCTSILNCLFGKHKILALLLACSCGNHLHFASERSEPFCSLSFCMQPEESNQPNQNPLRRETGRETPDLLSGKEVPAREANTPDLSSASLPEAESKLSDLSPKVKNEIDTAVERVVLGKENWKEVGIAERVELLGELMIGLKAVAKDWVRDAQAAKQLDPGTTQGAEEWLVGPVVTARNIRLLVDSLNDIEKSGIPQVTGKIETRDNGQVVAQVFPSSVFDKLLFSGFTAEIWMQPGVTESNLSDHMASAYKKFAAEAQPSTALVLGAGNNASIAPMDALYKLFVDNKPVVLKMNPVNDYLGPHLEKMFQPLIERGALSIVYGGAAEGEYLCNHPQVDEIHITGSDKTHDAIVFGTGEEGARRKAENDPRNTRPITSELGNVSPVIVVPGPWKESDLRFQGENLASMLTNNAGFNCNATRVIITSADWSQREDFIGQIEDKLGATPTRVPYYPGARQRYQEFLDEHPEASILGTVKDPQELPWAMISGLDPEKTDEICFQKEAFCGLTSEVPLSAKDTVDFIKKAVEFANDRCWGSLNASIIVHPKTLKDPTVAAAVEEAIGDLKVGSVGVNHWAALSYALVSTTWGAFPGNPLNEIGSGRGVVHNTYMFDKPEKSVIRGPFKVWPKPLWFSSHKGVPSAAPKLFDFETKPSWLKLPGLIKDALRG